MRPARCGILSRPCPPPSSPDRFDDYLWQKMSRLRQPPPCQRGRHLSPVRFPDHQTLRLRRLRPADGLPAGILPHHRAPAPPPPAAAALLPGAPSRTDNPLRPHPQHQRGRHLLCESGRANAPARPHPARPLQLQRRLVARAAACGNRRHPGVAPGQQRHQHHGQKQLCPVHKPEPGTEKGAARLHRPLRNHLRGRGAGVRPR